MIGRILNLSNVEVTIVLFGGIEVLIRPDVEYISDLFVFVASKAPLFTSLNHIEFFFIGHDGAHKIV